MNCPRLISETIMMTMALARLSPFSQESRGFSWWTFQWKITGMMNPMTGLIVAPAKVMASPILLIMIDRRKHTKTSPKVTRALTLVFIPLCLKRSSSTVSFAGRTQSGAAVRTAKNRVNCPYNHYLR